MQFILKKKVKVIKSLDGNNLKCKFCRNFCYELWKKLGKVKFIEVDFLKKIVN